MDARWEVVERNITNLMVGGYPRDELWRLWAALFVLAAVARLRRRRDRRAAAPRGRARVARDPLAKGGVRRLGPIILLVVVLLWLAQSLEALVLVAAISAVGAVFNVIGRRTPRAALALRPPDRPRRGLRRLPRRGRLRRRRAGASGAGCS